MKTYFFRVVYVKADGEIDNFYVPIMAKHRRSAFLNLIRQLDFLIDGLLSIDLENCDE